MQSDYAKFMQTVVLRQVFQYEVLAPLVEDPILQMNLALKPGQRFQSQ
jgi:hypothetical protein